MIRVTKLQPGLPPESWETEEGLGKVTQDLIRWEAHRGLALWEVSKRAVMLAPVLDLGGMLGPLPDTRGTVWILESQET